MTLFLLGLLSLLSQVVLLRELNVAFYGVELIYLVALAAWLAGTALGAGVLPRSWRGSQRAVSWLLAASAILLLLGVALVRASRRLFDAVPGAYLPLDRQAAVLVVVLVPIACLFGLAFRWAAANRVAAGGTLAHAYAVESVGAAAGGLAATVAFQSGAANLSVALAASVLVLAVLGATLPRSRRGRAATAALLLAAGAVVVWSARAADVAMTRWNHPGVTDTRDTPYSRVTITRAGGQVSVFENDVLTHESETAENEELPHLAALQHPSPARVLLLGGIAEQVEAHLWRHHPASIEHVEMDRILVGMVERNLGTPTAEGAGRQRLIIDDPRAYLKRHADRSVGSHDGGYDLIVVALPEPSSGQANRFYTREFFELCAARLAPGGVLAFRLRLPENYLARPAVLRAASVTHALGGVFPNVECLTGVSTIVVASRARLPSKDEVQQRWADRSIGSRLVSSRYIDYLYESDRRSDLARALAAARVPLNSDAQPVCYFFASVAWLSKFVPDLIASNPGAMRLAGIPMAWRWAGVAVLAALFAACRRRQGTRRAALALAAGFVGMALETVVLLDYQATNGALFEDLGLLVMAFMIGSAAGSWMVGAGRFTRALLLGGLAACSVATAWLVASGISIGLAGGIGLLAVLGVLVGGLFAAASRIGTTGSAPAIGRLYAADLVGGCLGGLAASLVLVPLGGLDVTALFVAALSAVALLLA